MLEPPDREAFAKALEAGVPRSCDANGGSPVQANELDFEKPRSAWATYRGARVDEDLTTWDATQCGGGVSRLPVEGFSPAGVSLYPRRSERRPLFAARSKDQVSSVMPGADKRSVFAIEEEGGNAQIRGGRAAARRARAAPAS